MSVTREQAIRRLRDAYCEECGYQPTNRSQALAHAAACGSIVAPALEQRNGEPATARRFSIQSHGGTREHPERSG